MQISHKVQVFFCDFTISEVKSFEAPPWSVNLFADATDIKPAPVQYNIR